MDRRRCHKGQRGKFCENASATFSTLLPMRSVWRGIWLAQLVVHATRGPDFELHIGQRDYFKDKQKAFCGNGTCENLVSDPALSSLILNMVLFGPIRILFSWAWSKLKQSTVSGVFEEDKLHRILKPCLPTLASECKLPTISVWGTKLITRLRQKYVSETPSNRRQLVINGTDE